MVDIYGFVLESDANTIVGLGFYEHGETPGLGGEVDNPSWKAKWSGRHTKTVMCYYRAERTVSRLGAMVVDGLSGATLTTKGVATLFNTGSVKTASHFSATAWSA